MTKLTTKTYSFRIVCEDDDAPNPVHLCEEIQAYLNSNHHLLDETDESYVDAKVISYRLETDNQVPFFAAEEY